MCLDTDSHNHHSEQALPMGWRGVKTSSTSCDEAATTSMSNSGGGGGGVRGVEGAPHPCPNLPAKASMIARRYDAALDGPRNEEGRFIVNNRDDWVWEVYNDETGEVVMTYPERDLRFSVSCKVHVFPTQAEADVYHGVEGQQGDRHSSGGGAAAHLDVDTVLRDLVEDLRRRGHPITSDIDANGRRREWHEIPLTELAPVLVDVYVTPTNPAPEEIERVWFDFHNDQGRPPVTPKPGTPVG